MQLDVVSQMDAREVALEDVDPDPHSRQVRDLEERCLGLDHLPQCGVALDDRARERRPDLVNRSSRLVVPEGSYLIVRESEKMEVLLGATQRRVRLACRGLGGQHLLLRGDAIGEQTLFALEGLPRQLRSRPRLEVVADRLAKLDRIDARENLPRPHVVTNLGEGGFHAAADARAHMCESALVEVDRAGRLDLGAKSADLGCTQGDSCADHGLRRKVNSPLGFSDRAFLRGGLSIGRSGAVAGDEAHRQKGKGEGTNEKDHREVSGGVEGVESGAGAGSCVSPVARSRAIFASQASAAASISSRRLATNSRRNTSTSLARSLPLANDFWTSSRFSSSVPATVSRKTASARVVAW